MFFGQSKKNKEETHYDPTNLKIVDLRKGWIFEYDLQTWEAVEEFEYDWGNDDFTYEFKMQNDKGESFFLSMEEDDFLEITVSEKVSFSRVPVAADIRSEIQDTGKAPSRVEFDGRMYYLESDAPGFWRNINDSEFERFYYWEYVDESETYTIVVEQWSDNSFEASIGQLVNERDFSNLLPK